MTESFPQQAPIDTPRTKKQKSWLTRVIDVLASFQLATALILLLMILTWLATLEQTKEGLHATLNKYFTIHQFFIRCELYVPNVENPLIIPMPGGWWVLALLFVNLLIGGIIRSKKTPKKIFIFIAHCGILFMVLSAGVTQIYEERGAMAFVEGQTSNVAQDYHEHVVEIAEHTAGTPTKFHVIRGKYFMDLDDGGSRKVLLPDLPFDLVLSHYAIDSLVQPANAKTTEKVVDNFFILQKPSNDAAELNIGACYAKIVPKSGAPTTECILTANVVDPYGEIRPAFAFRVDDRVFTLDMRKFLWVMPFSVRLETAVATYYPNTSKPESFESRVTRIEDNTEVVADIRMNEPMRYAGRTFYQKMMGTRPVPKGAKPYSELEVVHNPADKWPEYSLYVVTVGLVMHFLLRLILAVKSTMKRFSAPI